MARRYDAEATRGRILKAAEHEFSRYGFDGARVDRIATRSKANKGMIYIYFGNKKALYKTVFLENYRKVTEQEELLQLTPADLPKLTQRILACYFSFHERNPHWWRFMAWENLEPASGISPEEIHSMSGRVMEHLHGIYHEGQKRGAFRKDVSFSSYIFNVMAASFFYRSNMATMSGTLLENLANAGYRETLIHELATMIDSGIQIPRDRP